jgi:hypothetical protein
MHRRGFLALTAGAAVVDSLGAEPGDQSTLSPHDQWLARQTRAHRCLFDFPHHGEGVPLIHMLNYVTAYRESYGESSNTVNLVGTFYGAPGAGASMPLAWNDAMWEKYRIGELLKLTDPDTRAPAKRNLFYRPRAGDPVFRNGSVLGAGIENLQRLGATFLMCNNAFMAWMGYLSGSGTRGNAAQIEQDIRSNLLPGVVTVPAMVIAIEKAQGRGIAYNRQ